jgi:hypothetical protein
VYSGGTRDGKGLTACVRIERSSCRAALEWLSSGACVKLGDMKKQASDQSFHDRRYQERKRAEAAKKAAPKKVVRESGREGTPVKKD